MKVLLLRSLLLSTVLAVTCPPASTHPGTEQTLHHLDQLISTQPQQQALYLQRAWLLYLDGQLEYATADVSIAEKLGNPTEASFMRGALSAAESAPIPAIHHYNQYLQLHPGNLTAIKARAEAERDAFRYTAALDDYQFFLANNPYPAPGHFLAAAGIAQLSGNSELALALIDQGIDKIGLTPPLQQYAVELELGRRHFQAAIQRWQALATAMNSGPLWRMQMAELYFAAGALDQAELQLHQLEVSIDQIKPLPWIAQLQTRIQPLRDKIITSSTAASEKFSGD